MEFKIKVSIGFVYFLSFLFGGVAAVFSFILVNDILHLTLSDAIGGGICIFMIPGLILGGVIDTLGNGGNNYKSGCGQ